MTDSYRPNRPCPECGRMPGVATYSCAVPGCLAIRLCCPACMGGHMGKHVRDRDNTVRDLGRERDEALAAVDEMTRQQESDESRADAWVGNVKAAMVLREALERIPRDFDDPHCEPGDVVCSDKYEPKNRCWMCHVTAALASGKP